MYLYLYDTALKQRQYERVVSNLETQLTDLGIAGKIVRLSSLLSPRQVIQEEVKRSKETKTIIIVGDDTCFTRVIQQAADTPGVTFGWVPVGPKTDLAERFGLPYGAACAPILSRRRAAAIDIGQFNQYFFIDYCHVPLTTVTMALDGKVTITATAQKMECSVWNIPPTMKTLLPAGYLPSPSDRQFEIVLQPIAKRSIFGSTMAQPSIFPFNEVRLKLEKTMPIELDGQTYKENQITIKLAPFQLKLIVGKISDVFHG